MTRSVSLDAAAYEDLLAATQWYEVHARPGVAERFASSARALLQALERDAVNAQWVSQRLSVRRVRIDSYPYQLLYVEEASDVRVFAVAHLRRKPGHWRTRL